MYCAFAHSPEEIGQDALPAPAGGPAGGKKTMMCDVAGVKSQKGVVFTRVLQVCLGFLRFCGVNSVNSLGFCIEAFILGRFCWIFLGFQDFSLRTSWDFFFLALLKDLLWNVMMIFPGFRKTNPSKSGQLL